MKLRPLRDWLVVRLLPEPKPQGLIQTVELHARPSVHAEIVAVGPETREARVGQRVVVSRLQGITVDLGEPLVLMRETAVLATL